MGIPLSGVGTTEVGAGVGAREVVDAGAAVAGVWFSLPEVARPLEAAFWADFDFWAKSRSFPARAFAVGLFSLVPDWRGIRRSVEESDHEPKWRGGETYR